MIVLGLILVIVAIAGAVLLFLGTQSLTTPVDLDAAGIKVGLTPLALLIAGAIVMLLLWFGLGMMRGSMKRKRRPGREAKEAQRQAELEESIRGDERTRAEETHQSALADRDRVKDAELESKLAERDRARDDEFRTREREIEDRVRADERTRVEREFNDRQAAAAVPAAGAAGAAATHGDHPVGDRTHDHDGHDGGRHDRTEQGTGAGFDDTARGDAAGLAADSRSDDADRTGDGSEGERLYSPTDTDADRDADGQPDAASDRPVHRTVADRIMGRDPQGHN